MTLRIEEWIRRLTLPRLRASARPRTYRRIWALSGIAYFVISLLVGQMLLVYLPASPLDSQGVQVFWISPQDVVNPYLAPAVLVVAPHVVLALALWPVLVMTALALGIGLSIASTVSAFVAQRRRQAEIAASGVTPAVAGWAFLGACCCTGCAAQVTATGLVGAAVGSTPSDLIAQAWPLAALQLAIVGLSLLYMEYRLERPVERMTRSILPARLALAITVRIGLLIAGITWLFAALLEISGGTPVTGATLYHWTVEHGVLSGFAVVCALNPAWVQGRLAAVSRLSRGGRGLLFLGGITWGLWVPAAAVAFGLGGLLNELEGYFGGSAGWGAVAPDAPVGAPLLFHWVFQHALLAGWAMLCALRPSLVLDVVGVGESQEISPSPGAVSSSHVPGIEAKGHG